MHPTGGNLRVFKRFAWLEAGFGKAAFPPPAHPPVTHAVRCGQRNRINYKRQCWVECPSNARRGLHERSSPFLARPRELRGRMGKGIVPIQSPHLTKRALDAGDSAHFQALSTPQLFSSWTASPSLRPSASNTSHWALKRTAIDQ